MHYKNGVLSRLIIKLVRTNSISETLGIVDKQLITKYILPNNRKSSNNICYFNRLIYFFNDFTNDFSLELLISTLLDKSISKKDSILHNSLIESESTKSNLINPIN